MCLSLSVIIISLEFAVVNRKVINSSLLEECTIKELAETVRDVVYADVPERNCDLDWDPSKPNGTPRKLCDVTRLNALGWKAKVDVREGVKISYNDFLHGDVRK